MIEQKRDLSLLILVGALMLVGIGFDLVTDDADPTRTEPTGFAYFERGTVLSHSHSRRRRRGPAFHRDRLPRVDPSGARAE